MSSDEFDSEQEYPEMVEADRTSKLKSDEIEEARCFLMNVFGAFCGAGDEEGRGCGRSAVELYKLWEAKVIESGKKVCECGFQATGKFHKENPKICPKCQGVRRKLPTLVVNEKKGYGLHTEVKYGNVNLFCHAHNKIFKRPVKDSLDSSATAQMKKSHQVRPKFKKELPNVLAKVKFVCYMKIINLWSGRADYNCAQETLEKAFSQIEGTVVEKFKIFDFDMKCDYVHCNGDHVKLVDEPMENIISDYMAWKKQQEEEKESQKDE